MRRFINSLWLVLLMWSGPIIFVIAWSWLFWHCGFLNGLLFIALMATSASCDRKGPVWAARFVLRRVEVVKARVAGGAS